MLVPRSMAGEKRMISGLEGTLLHLAHCHMGVLDASPASRTEPGAGPSPGLKRPSCRQLGSERERRASAHNLSMTQAEFNSLWKETPACEQGMVLLKNWYETDAGALDLLPILTNDLEQPLCIDPDVELFVRHRNSCRECGELHRNGAR